MISASETASSARPDFLLLGGHPTLDFANTLVPPPGPDLEFLQSWQDVADWLIALKLAEQPSLHIPKSEEAEALKAVKALRRAWRATLEDIIAGQPVRPAFIEQLNAILRADTFREVLHPEGKKGFHLHRTPSPLKGRSLVLALLARQMAEFLATADFTCLRRCANHDSCVLMFYDTTKNHRRQWCSNATCGNRHKVAEFRRRQRA